MEFRSVLPDVHSRASMRLRVGEALTIQEALEAKRELLDALQAASALELDLSGVQEIDTAGVQLLLLLRREAASTGKSLVVAAASEPVREALELYRLAFLLAGAAA